MPHVRCFRKYCRAMGHAVDAGATIDVPDTFCWTKYGTEAGEDTSAILARKDSERRANDGVFLWGIGNAVGPSIMALLSETRRPKVVFTPMLSKPAMHDVAPPRVAVWHRGVGLDGTTFDVPPHSRVTSRVTKSKRAHYALVCRSEAPLADASMLDPPSFSAAHVANLRSGSRVGASQVTAVVRRIACSLGRPPSPYLIAFSADLVAPYFVLLSENTVLGQATP
jgi:hypothetical protein